MSMPVPEWAGDLSIKMVEALQNHPPNLQHGVVGLKAITCFSSFFAEYDERDDDLIVHFFPRNGEVDEWRDGQYLNRCYSCHRDVPAELAQARKPCPKCGHVGLVYVPGRREEKTTAQFPKNMEDLLKQAINSAWMGDAAVELVPELGAYVVQLQGAHNTLRVVGEEKFMDKLCETLDSLMDKPTGG